MTKGKITTKQILDAASISPLVLDEIVSAYAYAILSAEREQRDLARYRASWGLGDAPPAESIIEEAPVALSPRGGTYLRWFDADGRLAFDQIVGSPMIDGVIYEALPEKIMRPCEMKNLTPREVGAAPSVIYCIAIYKQGKERHRLDPNRTTSRMWPVMPDWSVAVDGSPYSHIGPVMSDSLATKCRLGWLVWRVLEENFDGVVPFGSIFEPVFAASIEDGEEIQDNVKIRMAISDALDDLALFGFVRRLRGPEGVTYITRERLDAAGYLRAVPLDNRTL